MHFWLGMKYNKDSQSFEWANGDDFSYAHWAEFEPGMFFKLKDLTTFNYFFLKILSITNQTVQDGVPTCTELKM